MSKRIALFFIVLLWCTDAAGQQYVSPTRYDWSQVAGQIAGNAADKRDQAYRIYRWLCENIAYDTTYTIHTADEAFDNRRGVCQAYSELFYRIAEPLGLKVDIVAGKSKDRYGNVSAEGHAWVFVHTDGNAGILVDPTWGAGAVDGGRFIRGDHDDSWFHVDPHWMIFSHFPDVARYQLLPRTIDYETFVSLPGYRPAYGAFGQHAQRLFDRCLAGDSPSVPDYYPDQLAYVEVESLPAERVLHVGRYYRFALKPKRRTELMIRNGAHCSLSGGWNDDCGVFSCNYMPAAGGSLTVSTKNPDGTWSVLAEYEVAEPDAEELARLEAAEPQRSPAFARVENFYPDRWTGHGVRLSELLAHVKAEGIERLPLLGSDVPFAIDRIPWNGVLRVGCAYTFRLSAPGEVAWAVINEGDWYRDWTVEEGWRTITVTPARPGQLMVGAKSGGDGVYHGCIVYRVE